MLEEQKVALTYLEVSAKIIEKNYIDWSNTKTPADTVSAQLGSFIRKNDTRVKRVKGKKGFKYYLSKYEEEIDLASAAGKLVELDNEIEDVNNEIIGFCNKLGIVSPFKTI